MERAELTPPRRRGRPRLTEPSETLHIRVHSDIYDRVCRIALRTNKPVTVIARMLIERGTTRTEADESSPISA